MAARVFTLAGAADRLAASVKKRFGTQPRKPSISPRLFKVRWKKKKHCPFQQMGEVRFYALTDAGVFSAKAPEADLRAGRGPFASLSDAMQQVITAYRIH